MMKFIDVEKQYENVALTGVMRNRDVSPLSE